MIKKVLHLVRLWDGFWSIPLAFIAFLLCEYVGRWFFGNGFGAYDPSTFQAAMMAAVILIFGNTVVQFALKFNFPSLWSVYHDPESEAFKKLEPWQKQFLTVFMYCFFFVLLILLFLKLV